MKALLRPIKARLKSLLIRSVVLPQTPSTTHTSQNGRNWYAPALLGAGAIGERATRPETLRAVMPVLEALERDDYLRYLLDYYRAGLDRFGDDWRYADITTVLRAAADLVQPRRYLEIGVRRGRSLAVVAQSCPTCDMVGFDLWIQDYAGMPNPGPDFVRAELGRLGHKGQLDLIGGDSHLTVPRYLRDHPDAFFDLITVDGDHSRRGATHDLQTALTRLSVGGVLVFDDIVHPQLRHLRQVWQQVVERDPHFSTWAYEDLGYGVAVAVRRE